MSPGSGTNYSVAPRMIGASISGVLEIACFHPVDTVAKRLMSNTETIFGGGRSTSESMTVLSKTIFGKAYEKGFLGRWASLFPGVSFGAAYKVLQRTYKYGCQPILKDWMKPRFGPSYVSAFGEKNGKDLLNATSGALIGLGEIVLLPLDVLKIKAQTNPAVLQGRGVVEIFTTEGFALYRGWNWTAARNMPGSFALFGANSFMYTRVFGTNGPKDSSFAQIVMASVFGGTTSIIVSSPLDVIKTRIQNKPFDDPRSGASLLKDLVKEEGVHAFWKGLTPKLALIGPKLCFSFTIAQWLTAQIQKKWEDN